MSFGEMTKRYMLMIIFSRSSYVHFPMRNFKFIDNQQVAKRVVEMWYTKYIKKLL